MNLFSSDHHVQEDFSKNDHNNDSEWTDSEWIDGVDRCATCPNRPGGPLNKSGICCCAIPSMYGPNRLT